MLKHQTTNIQVHLCSDSLFGPFWSLSGDQEPAAFIMASQSGQGAGYMRLQHAQGIHGVHV